MKQALVIALRESGIKDTNFKEDETLSAILPV
jgi:hypothetical protein